MQNQIAAGSECRADAGGTTRINTDMKTRTVEKKRYPVTESKVGKNKASEAEALRGGRIKPRLMLDYKREVFLKFLLTNFSFGFLLAHVTRNMNKQTKNRRVKNVGIVADAARLGCSRIHLYLVLSGRRTSYSLIKRYEKLKGSH